VCEYFDRIPFPMDIFAPPEHLAADGFPGAEVCEV